MNIKLSALTLLLALGGFSSTGIAGTVTDGLSQAELDQINTACKAESQDAENPQWYEEECVAEHIQALKEKKGLVQPDKDES